MEHILGGRSMKCSKCHKKYTNKIEKEFIKMRGFCLGCEKYEADALEQRREELERRGEL